MNTVELAIPEQLTPRERAAEIATLLATALARPINPEQPSHERQIGLGFSARKSVHTTPSQQQGVER